MLEFTSNLLLHYYYHDDYRILYMHLNTLYPYFTIRMTNYYEKEFYIISE